MSAALKLTDEDVSRIAKAVAVELRQLNPFNMWNAPLPLPPATVYTTNKLGPHVPGKSRRWMLDHLSSMPGARKEGRDWVIDVDMYNAWATLKDLRRCGPKKRPAPPVHVPGKGLRSLKFDPADLDTRAERSLAAAGYRPTK